MRFSHFFIDRPIFATVLSILIVLHRRASPTSRCRSRSIPRSRRRRSRSRASYPGASAEVVADTVATPIEQEINGVEDMLYMSSQATSDGQLALTVTFELGTDLDTAQVLVQNRVAIAEPRLPEEVRRHRRHGAQELARHADGDPPQLARRLAATSSTSRNYATLQVRDVLARLDGVGDVRVFGARDYAMRIWLDPEKVAARNLTAGDVVAALRAQNVQVASGVLDQPPVAAAGRLPAQRQDARPAARRRASSSNIVVKTDEDGRVTRVARRRPRRARRRRTTPPTATSTSAPAVPLADLPAARLERARDRRRLIATDGGARRGLPAGPRLRHRLQPDRVHRRVGRRGDRRRSVEAVAPRRASSCSLFLQTWRAAIIPIVAIPVSLIGTFAVMAALGFSLNNLSLFGLVLAIGIVVDDAIVVVENVERQLARGPVARARRRTARWTRSAAR